ncbi:MULTISPECIES: TetR/AcrR family transcriptional regulator [unclassified Leifsonia]|uniref:TetR/AcrR family transcriptional regulator n=1 Tax=unclassified Leifsonia TaxID=2663824 RepID=UPI00036BE4DB|nr:MULTISPECIES: TetR/AcrR family transcriptional regulator [unclassified Leifsonia]TDP99382.1 TetR family transcriptional regulator [Leifsonia sp. 115AMFTsu3.1]
MDTDRRTRLTPDERRGQLVALGVAFLADNPLDQLSIEELSARAGVSRGLLFHYFGSKQGLHREVVRTARDSMLHATEPVAGLAPLDRLHDTLERIVAFVREHSGTFYSLVRGVASGDTEVRQVVEEARGEQADRVIAVFLELGVPDTVLLRIALRSWIAFAEEALVESAIGTDLPSEKIVGFLERSARGVVDALG